MKRTLVIGYGNTIRSDDGVGVTVAEKIENMGLAGVHVLTSGQLQIEFASNCADYDRIIFVDAAVGGGDVRLVHLTAIEDYSAGVQTHNLSPLSLMEIVRTVYGKNPEALLCAIPVEQFDVGMTLTEEGARKAEKAVEMICGVIEG